MWFVKCKFYLFYFISNPLTLKIYYVFFEILLQIHLQERQGCLGICSSCTSLNSLCQAVGF